MPQPKRFTPQKVKSTIVATSGDVSRAAQRLGCSRQTIYNYARKHECVSCAIDEARTQNGGGTHMPSPLEAPLEKGYREGELRDFFAARAGVWCKSLSLPAPKRVETEFRLGKSRIDILIKHKNTAFTIVEVKQLTNKSDLHKCRYPIPGQLYWYRDKLKAITGNSSEVNQVAAIDWEPTDRMKEMLNAVSFEIELLTSKSL